MRNIKYYWGRMTYLKCEGGDCHNVHGRRVIEFGMGDWKNVFCLKTQSYSRPVCIRFIFNFNAWGGNL
jgi:hypothetical protein